ncbi:hypothetical protein LguiA_004756 [Lonicera macranthoides]
MPTFLSLVHNKLEGFVPESLGEIPTRGCFANFKAESFGQNDELCGVPRLQGGVGSVYKRTLDVVNVVVKVFNLQLEKAFKSFDVECEVLRNIRHCNLTKIVSSCSNLDFLSLLLEYMPNGSLEKWLYPHNYCLTILEQLNIMINVAFALEYLHHGQRMPIIHCDLKPNNILLDKDMIAHVCDFGIAKLLGEKEFMAQTKTLATIGYMAPEHAAWRAETRAGKWSSGCGHERAASEFSAWKLRWSTSNACGHVPQWLKLIVIGGLYAQKVETFAGGLCDSNFVEVQDEEKHEFEAAG